MVRSTLSLLLLSLAFAGLSERSAQAVEPEVRRSTDWSLTEREQCKNLASEFSIPCGNYGVFHFGEGSRIGDCATEQGAYTNNYYSHPELTDADWPSHPESIEAEIPDPQTSDASRVAVIDLGFSPHGEQVAQLIATVAPRSEIDFYPLDSPRYREHFGETITDLHLLAALCRIRADVESSGAAKPDFINLSIGRNHAPEEDPRHGSDERCLGIPCHIARQIDWLNTDDSSGSGRSIVVTAAGNHTHATFPASLDATLSAGAVDVTALRELHKASSLPETGAIYDALLPAQNLCSRGKLTPFGTSLASAILTGALAANQARLPVPTGGRMIGLNTWDGCPVLSYDGEPMGVCLGGLLSTMGGLFEKPETECLSAEPDQVYALISEPGEDPGYPNLQLFNSRAIQPMPEGNYCVPCSGTFNGSFSDSVGIGSLTINLENTPPLPAENFVHAIYYRFPTEGGVRYYEFEPPAIMLEALRTGEVDRIILENVEVPLDRQPALEFVIKPEKDMVCPPGSDQCPRTSIPIQL